MADFVSTTKARYVHAMLATNSSTFDNPCSALYVATGGTVNVVLTDDTTVAFNSVPVGTILEIQAKGVGVVPTNTIALW
jgi:hypothetical protein